MWFKFLKTLRNTYSFNLDRFFLHPRVILRLVSEENSHTDACFAEKAAILVTIATMRSLISICFPLSSSLSSIVLANPGIDGSSGSGRGLIFCRVSYFKCARHCENGSYLTFKTGITWFRAVLEWTATSFRTKSEVLKSVGC